MSEILDRVADAIDAVDLFSRFNHWTSDHVPGLPIEICRHGEDGEPEIIVLKRFSADVGEDEALADMLGLARARAALEAMREPTEGMEQAGAERMSETEGFGPPQQSGLIFSTMIDAALKDPPA